VPSQLSIQLALDLDELRTRHRLRSDIAIRRLSPVDILLDGKRLTSFCSNDYLGLATHPDLNRSASEAFSQDGFGASASRLVCGTFPVHIALEAEIAAFLGTEAALLFTTGYQANIGVISALASPADLIVADRAIHASLIDACRLSGAKLAFYPHLDHTRAGAHLGRHGASARRRFVVTESLFSMDGDVAPLTQLSSLATFHDAILVVDEAHAIGCLGPTGTGLCSQLGVQPDVFIGTLGKAFGTAGAFIAGSAILREFLLNTSRTFIFTTAPPPPVAAAALAALRLLRSSTGDDLRKRLAASVSALRSALSLPVDPLGSPILPIILGTNEKTTTSAASLRSAGFLVQPIRPPAVREGTARLRITLSSHHTPDHISSLAHAIHSLHPSASRSTQQPLKPNPTHDPPAQYSRPIRGLLLVGTDTAVGKTTVARAILHFLRSRGHRPVPFKPVETGAPFQPSDAILLRESAGQTDLPLHIVCPYSFAQPTAPSVAASSSASSISLPYLLSAASAAATFGDFLLVESAGGLLTPYAPSLTACDIAAALALPILLVARNSLGTINHTALALSELRRRALPLLGTILVNTTPQSTPDQTSNASQIAVTTGQTPLGILPYTPSPTPAILAASLQSNINLDPLLLLLRR
jgi:8-amino-7-oxononanoate synthase